MIWKLYKNLENEKFHENVEIVPPCLNPLSYKCQAKPQGLTFQWVHDSPHMTGQDVIPLRKAYLFKFLPCQS